MSSDSRSTDVPNERREYFRIKDTVYLDYRVLEEGEMPPAEAEQAWPEHLKVLNELSTVSRHVNAMVPKLREFYPDITQFLVALNQKVDLLVALVMANGVADPVQPNRQVHISAGGVDFHAPASVEAGRILELRLVLFPSYTALLLYGTVLRCEHHPERHPDLPFEIAVEFTHIRDPQRDAIVRHVTDRQSAMLREARQKGISRA